MAVNVATLVARLEADIRDFDRDMKTANKRLDQLERNTKEVSRGAGRMTKSFDGVGAAIKLAVGAQATRTVWNFAQDTIRAASDLNEAMNKVRVIFEDSGEELVEWSENAAESFGLSQAAALDAVGSFGAMFDAMGITGQRAAEMSRTIVQLSADMGSFNNIDPTDMLQRLQSGLAGEIEPLRRFGVDLSAAATEAKAMELGLADATGALTQQDKVMARYFLILEQTTKQQGDFARTSEDLANKTRTAAARIEDLKAKIGEDLVPAQERGLDIVEALTNAYSWWLDQQLSTQLALAEEEELQRKAAAAATTHDTALYHLARQTAEAAAAQDDLGDELATVEDRFVRAERATRNYGRSLLGVSDPVFNALDQYERMNEVLEDTEASLIDQGLAVAEAAAAFGSLDDAQITAAIDLLATALGKAREEAELLLIQAGLLDGRRIAVEFAVDYEGLRGGIPEGANPITRTVRPNLPEFQSGGMVPGPIGEPQLAVVHGGEQVLTPSQQSSGGVMIENLNVRASWDFTDPTVKRIIVTSIEEALSEYGAELGV